MKLVKQAKPELREEARLELFVESGPVRGRGPPAPPPATMDRIAGLYATRVRPLVHQPW